MWHVTVTAIFKQNKNIIRFTRKWISNAELKKKEMKYNNRILVNYLFMLSNGVNKYLIGKHKKCTKLQARIPSFRIEAFFSHFELLR